MDNMRPIIERIQRKKTDYQVYNFTQTENDATKTFYDLAQEFDTFEDFYQLCVAIPKVFFNLNAKLFVMHAKYHGLVLVASTADGEDGFYKPPPHEIKADEHPYYSANDSLVITIRGNKLIIDQLPFKTTDDVLGLLVVYPADSLNLHRVFFFEKYANRIGFNIHNRFLVEKNVEHLKFIRTLVADIKHNVIVPNMIYKLFLGRLRGKILKNVEIEKLLAGYSAADLCDGICMNRLREDLTDVNHGLTEELENLEKHYQNMSLFLETLFRRSHFDQGHLTLRTKKCNMKKDVVQPQLERFMEQFGEAGIIVDDQLSGIPDEEVISVVDVGLIAQVFANLFSNALKYTQEILVDTGEKRKYISYGNELIRDFFGAGKDGVKYNVFNTGAHLEPEERERIFEEEYRGTNATNRPGTGHGLAFIKNAVEIHGGVVGYEPTRYGNNFYFILPK